MHDGCTPTPTSAPTQGSAPARRSAYWRSFEEIAGTEEFQSFMHREFQPGASELTGDDRRHFIKIMGASFALAGLALAGCRRWPESKIAEYASRPANRTPGVPVKFATSYELGGIGYGLLATSYDGRPIKLDGNPRHPASPLAGGAAQIDPEQVKARNAPLVGPSTSITQARILELYDPERSRMVMKSGAPSDAAHFSAWLTEQTAAWKSAQGAGLMVVAEPTGSPTLNALRKKLQAAYPKMTWATWGAINEDQQREGTKAAFGTALRAQPHFDKATVTLSLDCDFLGDEPNSVANARAWAAQRALVSRTNGALAQNDPAHAAMSRVYQVEGTLTLTGMSADHRLAVRPSQIAAFAASIADRLGLGLEAARALGALAPKLGEHDAEIVDELVKDLKGAGKNGLVVAGMRQPPVVHALAAAINGALGSAGNTVHYTAAPEGTCSADIKRAVDTLNSGGVETLVILGGNPVYDAPADLAFGTAMGKAKSAVHLSFHRNETSRNAACTWHVPAAHFLESWGDTTALDGTVAVQQPLIDVLIDRAQGGHSAIEFCAMLAGEKDATGAAQVRAAHAARQGGTADEAAWRTLLEAGVIAGTASAPAAVAAPTLPAALLSQAAQATQAPGTYDLVFFNDQQVFDGRFANVGWLQELPDLVTKITWDNALLMSKGTATALGVKSGDMVSVTSNGKSLDAAAWLVPGMADGTLGLSLGYGRGEAAGTLGKDAGFNAYAVRTNDAPWIATGATARKGTGSYVFAHTQDHGVADALVPSVPEGSIQDRLPTLLRESSLAHFKEHPDFAKHATHVAHRLSLWEEKNLDGAEYRWAMTIDLGTCIGCSACVSACQAENNIPIVGKDQVLRGREMHWIRVDRYFKGRDAAHPDGYRVQPVTCVQCENAPCEQVCPVAATSHDKDGLNNMVYNRCIGTRYCSNNCPYKVRRFNFFDFHRRDPQREEGILFTKPEYYVESGPDEWLRMQFNPDVTVRMRGVMEKCTFCTQRIQQAKIATKNAWVRKGGTTSGTSRWEIPDGTVQTACQQACPTGAIVFGDLMVKNSDVAALQSTTRSYGMLEELNTKPRLQYLARVDNPAVDHSSHDHDHGHGHDHDHDHDHSKSEGGHS